MGKILGNIAATPTPRSDWAQTDANKIDFILNKPTNVSDFENDAGYVTDMALVELETRIDEALDGKVDEIYGKGLSTNDFTDEYKSKVDAALQTETDPTVPAWAKERSSPPVLPRSAPASRRRQ